jgi:hypothetical protein
MSVGGFIVCICSSRTRNDFTQRMGRRAEAEGPDSGIYYSSKAFWERKPIFGLSGKTFKFDLGEMGIVDRVKAQQMYDDLKKSGEMVADEAALEAK